MYTKIKAALTAAAAVGVLALAGAAPAGAATVTIGPTGSGAMTFGANGGAARFLFTGGSPTVVINCTVSSVSGSLNTGAYTVTPGLPTTVGTILPAFTNCVGPVGLTYSIICTSGSPQTMFNLTSVPVAGTTPGSATSITCTLVQTATGCTRSLTGSVSISYTNPVAPSTSGRVTFLTAGQSLTLTGSGGGAGCPASGPVDLGAPGVGATAIVDLPYTLTGAWAGQPVIS